MVIILIGDKMKKIAFIITILFIATMQVFADDNLLINDLNVKNGELSPKFDKYNNYYSITIDNNVTSLDFEYEYNKDLYEVKITNNENLVENKLIYVTIYNKESKEKNAYIFKVYLENTQTTVKTVEEEVPVVKKKQYNYAPLVGAICFILIIFVYYVIFLR